MTTRAVAGLALLLLVLIGLDGCGRRLTPVPPTDEPVTYPRQYPAP